MIEQQIVFLKNSMNISEIAILAYRLSNLAQNSILTKTVTRMRRLARLKSGGCTSSENQ